MKWAATRQKVIADNVANANTPGFKSRDLKPLNFEELVKKASAPHMGLAQTAPGHIAPKGAAGSFPLANKQKATDMTISQNDVSLEDEMMKNAQTQEHYRLSTGLYRSYTDLLRSALGKGPGQ